MKTRNALVPAISLSILGLGAVLLANQPPAKEEQPAQRAEEPHQPDGPGAPHARLVARAGSYTVLTKTTFGDQPAMETRGTATITSSLGGRFITISEEGTLFGQPFQAKKTFGYNNATGKYESVWMYTGSTAMMTAAGESADNGKTVTYKASYEMAKGEQMKMTIVFKEVDENRFSIALVGDGPNPHRSEFIYTRTK